VSFEGRYWRELLTPSRAEGFRCWRSCVTRDESDGRRLLRPRQYDLFRIIVGGTRGKDRRYLQATRSSDVARERHILIAVGARRGR
jgi:hypothetical protein